MRKYVVSYDWLKNLLKSQISLLKRYEKAFGKENAGLIDVLLCPGIPPHNRIWLANQMVSEDILYMFSIDCALSSEDLSDYPGVVEDTDPDPEGGLVDRFFWVSVGYTLRFAFDTPIFDRRARTEFIDTINERNILALIWFIENEED